MSKWDLASTFLDMQSLIFILLVAITKIQDNEAIPTKPYRVSVDNSKNRKNRQQLIEIVKYLNENTDAVEQNEELEREDAIGSQNVQELMRIAQNNYDTRISYDFNKPNSRVHVIKNPQVLQEYMKALRRRHSTSSESSQSDSFTDWDKMQRRYADYENNKGFADVDSRENVKGKKSFVKGNIDFKISKDKKDESKLRNSVKDLDKYDDEHDLEIERKQPSYLKKKKNKENIGDPWDVITKDAWKDNTEFAKAKAASRKVESKKEMDLKNEWKEETKRYKPKKTSLENNDFTWKTTKRRKDYDSFESKSKKKVIYDYSKQKVTKYEDDWNIEKNKKRTTDDWDKLTTTRNWVKTVRKKQNRETYVKPSYVARIPIGRFGGGSFHGRTPIPFVGKRGIYEEN